jgi:hypothetical protein
MTRGEAISIEFGDQWCYKREKLDGSDSLSDNLDIWPASRGRTPCGSPHAEGFEPGVIFWYREPK